jgi:RnfABCDGE-type electron transport complex B subunit
VVLALLATAISWILGRANNAFYVHVDEKVAAIIEALPAANCGGCGYPGCAQYADAVAAGEAEITLCGPGGAVAIGEMAVIMGIDAVETVPLKAIVKCGATRSLRKGQAEYHGEKTCAAAALVPNIQGCSYGCLGFGDCAVVCEHDAIDIIDGLAVIRPDQCGACKECVTACPQNIIGMVPYSEENMFAVVCSNLDAAKDVKAVCDVGCIGCKICAKKTPFIRMEGNLPVIEYKSYDADMNFEMVMDKCPTNSIFFLGQEKRPAPIVAFLQLPENEPSAVRPDPTN